MKLNAPIVAKGDFWFIDAPDTRSGGTLQIDQFGDAVLELFDYPPGDLIDPERLAKMDFATTGRIIPESTICGFVYPYGVVTLAGCQDITPTYRTPPPSPLRFAVKSVFLGAEANDAHTISVETLRFSFEDLGEWLQISGLTHDRDVPSGTIRATYDPPANIQIGSYQDVDIFVEFSTNQPTIYTTDFEPNTVRIQEQFFISLRPNSNLELKQALVLAMRIRDLISLGAGRPLALTSIISTSSDRTNPIYDQMIDHPHFECIVDDGHRSNRTSGVPYVYMPFHLNLIAHKLDKMMNKWLANYDALEDFFTLYHSIIGNDQVHINTRFLLLTQVLEGMHRAYYDAKALDADEFDDRLRLVRQRFHHEPEIQQWLNEKLKYADEFSLRQRLRHLAKICKPAPLPDNFARDKINDLVDVRNFLTHRDRDISRGIELIRDGRVPELIGFMQAIFQLWNLKQIGFEGDMFEEVFGRSEDLREVFGYEMPME